MVQYLEMDGYVQCVMMDGYVQCVIEQYKMQQQQMLIVINIVANGYGADGQWGR